MYKFFDSVRCEKSKWPPLFLAVENGKHRATMTTVLLEVET